MAYHWDEDSFTYDHGHAPRGPQWPLRNTVSMKNFSRRDPSPVARVDCGNATPYRPAPRVHGYVHDASIPTWQKPSMNFRCTPGAIAPCSWWVPRFCGAPQVEPDYNDHIPPIFADHDFGIITDRISVPDFIDKKLPQFDQTIRYIDTAMEHRRQMPLPAPEDDKDRDYCDPVPKFRNCSGYVSSCLEPEVDDSPRPPNVYVRKI
mmetsp:Transcript_85745/g.135416  ORF Transcript_85745/g.135416 Transcript_85745/m.135416 type:complete len:205 (+) Transcript_85745:95-709(+)